MGFAGRQQKKCVWLIFRQPSMTGTEACPDRHGGLSYWLSAVFPGGSGVSVCELGERDGILSAQNCGGGDIAAESTDISGADQTVTRIVNGCETTTDRNPLHSIGALVRTVT